MKILAVEFSSTQRSAAVWESGGEQMQNAECRMQNQATRPVLLGSAMEPPERRADKAAGAGEHPQFPARRSLGLVEQALAEANCGGEEIGAVAVGLGPGSYTGIRGAIALAQGWELGRGVALLGVSSVECLAAQAEAEGRRGAVNIIVDAQRNEFYLARYEIDEGGRREIEALRLATMAEVQALAGAGQALLGPEIRQWFGSGTDLYAGAVMVGRLACGRRDFVPGEKLEPIYLRETAFKKAPPPRAGI
ncbi:MAG TPA: tRNA (adenosine(37)-N6)-threonylcarbamoyltransferase complex dimerization subunit type 1 TsaB [Candidatus Acidoferrum sp.]|nr:tRNA (adenosine(37)-N6)-threonylcarbamoyltransferase complex dimerization subunit type 1 TsaB [Candidatus Acidoferrum sp.]